VRIISLTEILLIFCKIAVRERVFLADIMTSNTENIEAYKRGVESKAPSKGWVFKEADRPAGMADTEFIGVEAHHENHVQKGPYEVRVAKGDMSLKAIFAKMANVPESSIKREIPGNTADYYREIGQHEAGHLYGKEGFADGGLGEEIHGDLTAYNGDNVLVEETLRDTRKLSSLTNTSHATSPALPDAPGGKAPDVNSMKLFAAAKTFRDTVAADLISDGLIQKVEDIKQLQESNPEAIRKSVQTLQKSGAFDDLEGSRGEYVRQYAREYLEASQKWLSTPDTSSPTLKAQEQNGAKVSEPSLGR
jgi:hypothetical protein